MSIYNNNNLLNLENIFPITIFKNSFQELKPLKVGENINTLDLTQTQLVWKNSLECLDKAPYLKKIQKNKPLAISFLSANWHKYGQTHLNILKDCYHEILSLGGNLLVIVQAGYEEVLEMVKYFNLPFTLLADPTNQIAKQFGTYSEKTTVWTEVAGGVSKVVPIPATCVIDKKGSIIYHSTDENFSHPFSPSEMLGAVFSAAHNIPYSINYQVAA